MSNITVHRLDARANARLAPTEQRRALAPFPERPAQHEWQFTRRAWAHGYRIGLAQFRFGPDQPARAASKQSALDQGIDPNLLDAIPLDQFIVTPDMIEVPVGGTNLRTTISRVGPRAQDGETAFIRSKRGGIAFATAQIPAGAQNAGFRAQGSAFIPGRVFLNHISVSGLDDQGVGISLHVVHSALGAVWSGSASQFSGGAGLRDLPLDHFIDGPTTISIVAVLLANIVGGGFGLNYSVAVSYNFGVPA